MNTFSLEQYSFRKGQSANYSLRQAQEKMKPYTSYLTEGDTAP